MTITVLMGNGVSIADNPDLNVTSLSTRLADEFAKLGGDQANEVLAHLANAINPEDEPSGFESILGPLDLMATALAAIAPLPAMFGTDQTEIVNQIEASSGFLRTVYTRGVAITLRAIDKESISTSTLDKSVTTRFVEAVKALDRSSSVTIATLNYDSLLLQGVLDDSSNVSDLAAGYAKSSSSITDEALVDCWAIRGVDNLPPSPIVVIQLHGSLGWLNSPEGRVYKFRLGDLRAVEYWERLEQGRTLWTPAVVLTSQAGKVRLVAEHPFSLAYEAFLGRLRASDIWIICGYGFGDQILNRRLGEIFRSSAKVRRVLVITYGEHPSESTVYKALGDPEDQSNDIVICRDGLPAGLSCEHWDLFS
ncbi:SIR2 family protein [Actinophytocola oryzae]|uniref:SIR2-like protein n=1 Tax=Actinophytocola oryzae TaxID=502181 RepID=A0A4R7V452_9PSEU|nr:SIR2 family protein [Actinophytocola oryzae]TDV43690.1 SIR2-like protein [Actinophytocola oryzae]